MVVRPTAVFLFALLVMLTFSAPGNADHYSDTARYAAGGHVSPVPGLAAPGACHTPNNGDAFGVLNCVLQCPPEGDTCTIEVEDDHWGPWGAWSRCVSGGHDGYGEDGSRTIPNDCDDGTVWVWPDLGATTGTIQTS